MTMVAEQDREAVIERLLRLSIPEPNSGCWLWLANARKNRNLFRPSIGIKGKTYIAARISLEVFKGSFSSELFACHTCHNTFCVNPDHLYPGTVKQNTDDMTKAGRHWSQKKSDCKRGHPLSGSNLYINPVSGARQCRKCNLINLRARRARNSSLALGQQ